VGGGGTLEFNPGDWNVTQNITVLAVDDDIIRAALYPAAIMMSTASADPKFGTLPGPFPVEVLLQENDSGGLYVALAQDLPYPAMIPEGRFARYEIRLASIPYFPVTVQIVDESPLISTSPRLAVFDSTNWDVPQLITVSFPQDNVPHIIPTLASVGFNLTSQDPVYHQLNISSLQVALEDDDTDISVSHAAVSWSGIRDKAVFRVTFVIDLTVVLHTIAADPHVQLSMVWQSDTAAEPEAVALNASLLEQTGAMPTYRGYYVHEYSAESSASSSTFTPSFSFCCHLSRNNLDSGITLTPKVVFHADAFATSPLLPSINSIGAYPGATTRVYLAAHLPAEPVTYRIVDFQAYGSNLRGPPLGVSVSLLDGLLTIDATHYFQQDTMQDVIIEVAGSWSGVSSILNVPIHYNKQGVHVATETAGNKALVEHPGTTVSFSFPFTSCRSVAYAHPGEAQTNFTDLATATAVSIVFPSSAGQAAIACLECDTLPMSCIPFVASATTGTLDITGSSSSAWPTVYGAQPPVPLLENAVVTAARAVDWCSISIEGAEEGDQLLVQASQFLTLDIF
jgi:hypothetical protein